MSTRRADNVTQRKTIILPAQHNKRVGEGKTEVITPTTR